MTAISNLWRVDHGNPKVRPVENVRPMKLLRCNSDHCKRLGVQIDCGANDIWIAVESRMPEVVTQDNIWSRVHSMLVTCTKESSPCRLDAQHVEVIAGSHIAKVSGSGFSRADCRSGRIVSHHSTEGAVAVAVVEIIRIGLE